ncbi:LOW QUALITY PROTEIN: VN1R2 isoform 1 [Pongo abelii]|uniref:Vomeronasal type-1 receptor n=1 Tax=Pongo abelii TaxID=9601 RepID=A0A2J8UA21_PONAB|nr:LOW QUALITY PROTEIN: VN1R2 isoform 1 [Pongo abelii]
MTHTPYPAPFALYPINISAAAFGATTGLRILVVVVPRTLSFLLSLCLVSLFLHSLISAHGEKPTDPVGLDPTLFQVVVGILGNFSLLCYYMVLYFRGYKPRSTDLILRHLTVADSLVILTRGIPETMATFGLKQFDNYFGCKFLLYAHGVGRGVSIGSTCLLSVLQVIIINPRNSRWAEMKVNAPKYIGLSNILCWAFHMLVNAIFPIYTTGKWSNNNITKKGDLRYCSAPLSDEVTKSVYAAFTSFHDVLCLGLTLWASSSIVLVLYRHKQRVQYICRNNLYPISSPENRAIQSILALVSTFVLCYALSFITYVYLALFDNSSWWLVNIAVVITDCFPTISPFVLMCRDPSRSRLCSMCCRRNRDFRKM